jgi:hypothetical protein
MCFRGGQAGLLGHQGGGGCSGSHLGEMAGEHACQRQLKQLQGSMDMDAPSGAELLRS